MTATAFAYEHDSTPSWIHSWRSKVCKLPYTKTAGYHCLACQIVQTKSYSVNIWCSRCLQVYNKTPEGNFHHCKRVCSDKDWTCMKIVRNPYARAVSSFVYIFTRWQEKMRRIMLKYNAKHEQLYENYAKANLSFREWLSLLTLVSDGSVKMGIASSHFLPQYVSCFLT